VLANLLPTGLVFLIASLTSRYFTVVRQEEDRDELVNQIASKVIQSGQDVREFEDAGIKMVYQEMPFDRIAALVAEARGPIKLMSTWLGSLTTSSDLFQKAAKNGNTLQILLLNPDSEAAKQRGIDLYGDPGAVKRRVTSSIDEVMALSDRYSVTTKIRLYDNLPSVQAYIIGDTAMAGFFWHGSRSTFRTQLEVSRVNSSYFGLQLLAEFEETWDKAKPYVPMHRSDQIN